MRFLLLALLAAPVLAEPHIRWIDRAGTVHRAVIAEVKAENATEIKVEQSDGKLLTVPTTRLLTLVRENETDAEQRALLDARGAAYIGGDLGTAIATCDRLAKSGKQEWIREYADVHRVLLAVRAREADARKRVVDCIDKYPKTRFLGWLSFARAQTQVREAKTGVEAREILDLAFEDIRHAKAPLIVAFECFVEQGRLYAFGDFRSVASFAGGLRGVFAKDLAGDRPDAGISVLVEDAIIRIEMAWHENRYAEAIKAKHKPVAPREAYVVLLRKARYLLPSLRSDINYEIGRAHEACGDVDKAKAAFEQAVKLASDPWRRARAARRARRQ